MKLKFLLGAIVVTIASLTLGFVNQAQKGVLINGCGGTDCHIYIHGTIRWRLMDNLRVRVYSRFNEIQVPIGAELRDKKGNILDFYENYDGNDVILNAPHPGRYKIMVGFKIGKPLWDSLWVTIPRSKVNIPTSRFGSGNIHLFPSHPTNANRKALLRFFLPNRSEIEISLYSMNGKKIRTIFSGQFKKGLHVIAWETRDEFGRWLPGSNYLCEIHSGSKKIVQTISVYR